MTCIDCGIPMVPASAYYKMTKSERAGLRFHVARGLCRACYERQRKRRTLARFPRTKTPGPVLIEDMEYIADSGGNLTEAIMRLRKTKDALWRACKRAGRMDLYWRLADRMPDAEHRRASRKRGVA